MESKKQPNLFFAGEVNIEHELVTFWIGNNTIYHTEGDFAADT